MKGSLALLRTRRRRSGGGFTLIELMVVVVLIAVLAALAAPTMTGARNDRLAFSYARQAGEMIHNARARAAGRGAAQLVVYTNNAPYAPRGALLVYEATDGLTSGSTPIAGPNPVSNCRAADQWTNVPALAPSAGNRWELVEGMNLNTGGSLAVQTTENILMQGRAATATGAPADVAAWVLCTTPNGTTYGGADATVPLAIAAMQVSSPFTGVYEVDVARHEVGGTTIIGLNRRVIVAGAGAPRIKSE